MRRPGQPAGKNTESLVLEDGGGQPVEARALLLERDLSLRLGSRLLPPALPGQALVRVEWAGVCGSDLHVLRTGAWVSYWPATIGHEVIGVVEACPGGELAPGQRVVVDSRVPCGNCQGCQIAANLCERLAWVGEALPGGFASHLLAPVTGLVACPTELEPEVGVLSEPLAVAMHAVARLPVQVTEVLILGYGPVGALIHLEITHRWPGAAVTVAEPHPARRMLATALGAEMLCSGQRRWPLVIDAAGYPGSLPDALATARTGGTLLLVALGHEAVQLVPARLVESEMTVLGSNGFAGELAEAVSALACDPDRWRPVISEAVLLDDAAERLPELTTSPAPGKVVIRP
jgi:2-desacetyl-2-hydroxyethyl bacteriochlorophyllide A dehydrogenase